MAYRCKSCSYQVQGKFPGGRCPACDSFNIERLDDTQAVVAKTKKRKSLFEIALLILFWSLLAYMIWRDYLQ